MQYSLRILISFIFLFFALEGFSSESPKVSSAKECTVCNNVTYGGKIQADETGCGSPGWDPSIITNQEFPSGGSGMMEYMWLFTTDDPSKPFTQWNQIPNSNSPNYDPGVIYKTTYYTRCSRRMGCTEFPGESNIVTKTFNCCNSLTSAGKIGTNQTGCLPSFDPFTLTNITYPSGGSGVIQYLWYKSNQNIPFDKNNSAWSEIAGATDSIYNPTPITQNTYYVRLARRTGCIDYLVSNTVSVVLFTPPTVLTSSVSVKCAGGSDGAINTVVLGGKAPFTFQWDPNTIGNQQNPINLLAGNYQVTVTDANGCTVVKTVLVAQPPPLAVIFTNLKNTTCFGSSNGSVSANVTGGVTPYSYLWSNGSTAADLTGVTAGTYSVTVTDKNGCKVANSITISSPSSVAISISKVDNKCYGDKKGQATALGAGGVMPITYIWSTGQTTTSITNLGAGIYSVTGTDANGCTKAASVTINEPAALIFTVIKEDVKCFSDKTGSILLNVSNGTAPYNFKWSTGATTSSITNLSAGSYSVTVNDANGCTRSEVIVLTEPTILTLNLTKSDLKCNNDNSGKATASLSGGNLPYTYKWSNGATNPTIANIPAGSYQVTATDANGCTKTGTIVVSGPPALQLDLTKTENNCNGASTGSLTAIVAGGTPNYSYLWSNGATTSAINNLLAGVYTVTVTDANGCKQIASATITEPSPVVIVVSKIDVKCNGASTGSISLVVTGGTAPYTYLWSNGATIATISNLPAGSYAGTVTDANGCKKTASANISEPSSLVVTLTKVDAKCNGSADGSINLVAVGGTAPYTYLWSNGATTATVNNLTAGTYSGTVTDANGCTKSGAATISEPSALIVGLSKVDVKCNGDKTGAIVLTTSGGTAPYTYIWNTGATSSSVSNLSAGSYTATITDANGCKKTAATTITEPTAIVVSATKVDVKCNGGNSGSISLTVSGGTAPYTYLWSTGSTAATIGNLVAGTYSGTVTDANGCKKSATATIVEPIALVLTATKVDVLCNGNSTGSIALVVNGGTAPYSYLWSNGGTTPTINNLSAGSYSGTVTDANGCTKSATATITEPSVLNVVLSKVDVKCNGDKTGAIVLTASGGTASYTYIWNTGATSSSVANLSAGTYSATITDANGCKKTAATTITEPTALVVSATKVDVKCNGGNTGSISLTVSGGTAPYTYLWSTGSTTATIGNLAAGTYSGTVTDANGCKQSATATINEASSLSLTATKVDVKCNGNNSGSLALVVTGGTAPYTYLWSNGATTPNINNLTAGSYSGTVTDANGCTKSATATITEPTVLNVGVSKVDVKCNGDKTGAIVLTASGGTAPYTYIWNTGATSSSVSNLSAGSYAATITDANGCKKTAATTITAPTSIVVSATKVDVKCNGGNTGSISLAVSGGTAPYTYLWSTGSTAGTIGNLVAGTYSGTVTDANGCKQSATATINEASSLNLTATKVDVKCNGNNTGSISLIVTGGTAPYAYLWSNGATTATIANLTAGNYSGTVTDANGCTKSATATILEPSALIANVSKADVKCNGGNSGAAVAVVSGGTLPYTYLWSNGGTTSSIANLAAGTYVLTITDGNGCKKVVSIIINQASSIEIVLTKTDVKCYSCSCGSASVAASGGTAPYTYLWSNGKTTELNDKIKVGTYTVTVTDVNGCSKIGSITIDQPTPLELSIEKVDVTCAGSNNGSATMNAVGGTPPYKYLWSNGKTTKVIDNLTPGVYEITVTDANNCVQYDAVEILEPAPLETVVSTVDPKCFGANSGVIAVVVSGGTAPYTYLWSNGATSATIGNLSSGVYNLTITDANGCKKIVTATLKEATILVAIIDKVDVKCFGSKTGSATVNASGGSLPYTYLWSTGATTQSIANLGAGVYSVTIADANGCTKVSSTVIVEPGAIQINAQITPVKCHGGNTGTINLTVSGGTAPYTYSWNNGSVSSSISNLPAGDYTVTVTDANLCTQKLVVTIVQPSLLVASIAKIDVKCNGGTDGSATVTATGGTQPYTYSWNTGATTQTIINLTAGKYSAIVTDANGCQTKVDVEIGEKALLLISITKTTLLCANSNNGTATAFATGGTAPYTYLWNNGQTTASITNLSAGTYTVTVTDANGCKNSGFITIAAPNPVVVTLTKMDVNCFGGSDGKIEAIVSGGTAPYDFLWSNGIKTSVNNSLPQGIYTVSVTDANKCVASASTTILEPKELDVTTFKKDPKCNDGDDGEIKINVNGGTPPYVYKWSNGASSSLEKNLKAGVYVITVLDANKCQKVVTVVLNNPPAIVADLNTIASKCFGQTGSATVSVSGGTPGYTYLWSNGVTTATNNTLQAGPFAVTITDSNGCKLVKSGTMIVPSALVCTASSIAKANCTDITKYGGSDGVVKVVVTGGTGAYSYLWNTGATSDVVSGLTAGTYTVTVTDANGCICSSSVTLRNPARLGDFVWVDNNRNGLQDLNEAGKAGVIVTLTGTGCSGTSVTKTTVTDSVGKYVFDGLYDGAYKVTFGIPSDYKFTSGNVGANDNIDSDADAISGMTAVYTVKQGDDIKDVDAGIYRKVNIGDFVWIDGNLDGLQDSSESGINGIKVKLSAAGPDGVFGTADDVMVAMQNTLDKNGKPGYYLFSDVAPGNYCITFSNLPADYVFTSKNQGANDNIDSDVDTLGALKLTVVAGQNDDLSFDAGIRLKCNNVLFGGTIGSDQILCGPGKVAAKIVNLLSPTGGSGTLEYLWLKGTVGPNYVPGDPNWVPIPNTNSADYSPGVLSQTTYFVRCSRRAPCTDYPGETNIVTIKVESIPVAAFAAFPTGNICVGTKHLVSAVDAGVGASYDWVLGGAVPGLANTRVVNNVKWSVQGSYTVNLTVTKNTCVNNKTVTVQVVGCINGNIEFGALTAKVNQGNVDLAWSTISPNEENYLFEVERSEDGRTFKGIGNVDATKTDKYEFVDQQPRPGKNYYRIKHLATNNKIVYSNIASVLLEVEGFDNFLVYPNPVQGKLFVKPLADFTKDFTIQLVNPIGQVLKTLKKPGDTGILEIDLTNYPSGMYLLYFNFEGYRTHTQWVIKTDE